MTGRVLLLKSGHPLLAQTGGCRPCIKLEGRMFVLRFVLPLLLALTGVAVVATPLAENFVSHWFQRDISCGPLFFSPSNIRWQTSGIGANGWNPIKSFSATSRATSAAAACICSADGELVAGAPVADPLEMPAVPSVEKPHFPFRFWTRAPCCRAVSSFPWKMRSNPVRGLARFEFSRSSAKAKRGFT